MTDANSCGACGHVCGCGSTSCTAGVCDAYEIASNQVAPVELALHGDQLYWGTDGSAGANDTVSTAPVAGGTAGVLFPNRTAVRGFAFDATRIYFSRFVFNIPASITASLKARRSWPAPSWRSICARRRSISSQPTQ
jgi:hypothetical protein